MNLGKLVKDSALAGITKGLRKTELNYNRLNIFGIGRENEVFGVDGENTSDIIQKKGEKTFHPTTRLSLDDSQYLSSGVFESTPYMQYARVKDDDSGDLFFNLPKWGYDDFINERNIWLKQITNKLNGPSLFYFKIFFEFNTNHGLFGGILNDTNKRSVNSAYQYLSTWQSYYEGNSNIDISNRLIALEKFTKLLSYISMHSPWFFKSVKNLQNAASPYLNEFGKEKYLNIEFEEEAIDMRLSTLFSLYKYACFDDINCKEIIPENLRKFNMIVVLFESPIKYIHTPIASDGSVIKKSYKELWEEKSGEGQNTMSFKTFTFKNCEFAIDSINSYIKGDVSNESGFNLGKNDVKIKYDRVYEHLSNEYMGFLFGSDGFYFFNDSPSVKTYNYIHDDLKLHRNVVTASEELIRDNIQKILGSSSYYALGNIFGQDVKLYKSYPNMSINRSNPTEAKNYFTEYTKAKFGMYGHQHFSLVNLGFNMLYKWLGSDYHAGTVSGINDVGTVLSGSSVEGGLRLKSKSYDDKLKRIKYGPSVGTSVRNARMNLEAAAKNLNYNVKQQITKNALNTVKTGNFVK